MFDRTFVAIQPAGAAGPVARSFDIRRPDTDERLMIDVTTVGTDAWIFTGSKQTSDCQAILANTSIDQGGELVTLAGSGAKTEGSLGDDVRQITVYIVANAPANAAGVAVRVRSA